MSERKKRENVGLFVKENRKGKAEGCSIDDENKAGRLSDDVAAKMKEGTKCGLYVLCCEKRRVGRNYG